MDNKTTLQNVFIFGLFILMFAIIIGMMKPFFTVILWTILLYILINPLHFKCIKKLDRTKKSFQFKRHLIAALFSAGTLLLIVGPIIGIGVVLVQQLLSFLKSVENFISENPSLFTEAGIIQTLSDITDKLNLNFVDFNSIDLKTKILQFIEQYSSKIFSMGSSLISGTGNFIVSLLFVSFALYFCFLDGRYLASLIAKAIPIKPKYMSKLMAKFAEITRHLFSGYILVALYQGTAAFLIMLIFGVQGALLFSVILMFASFIPLFGTAIVWVPVGIGIIFTDGLVKGILFLIICGICVSMLDNFLRPMFLKDRVKVHPLVIFFAILGGLKLFGLNGLILGPLVIILFFTVLDMLVNSEKAIENNAE